MMHNTSAPTFSDCKAASFCIWLFIFQITFGYTNVAGNCHYLYAKLFLVGHEILITEQH